MSATKIVRTPEAHELTVGTQFTAEGYDWGTIVACERGRKRTRFWVDFSCYQLVCFSSRLRGAERHLIMTDREALLPNSQQLQSG